MYSSGGITHFSGIACADKNTNCLNIMKCGALGCKEAKCFGEGRGSVGGEFEEPRNLHIPKGNSLRQSYKIRHVSLNKSYLRLMSQNVY